MQSTETVKESPSSTPTPVAGSLLAANSLWNLAGTAVPLLGAVISIPRLQRGLGTDAFGILLLAWATAGYFTLFDFGLGRAVTKLVAEKLGSGEHEEIPSLFWTSTWIMGLLGVCGTVVAALLTKPLVLRVLKVPASLHTETVYSFYLLALVVPWLIASTGFRGVLEAQQRFNLVNIVKLPMGLLLYIGPLAVLSFSKSLAAVIGFIVILRVVGCLLFFALCMMTLPELRKIIPPSRATLRPLFGFGAWMTVSNVISPILATFDRFFIGAMLSLAAVAYYSTPFEVITKLMIVPGAVMGVMFPAFSSTYVQDPERTTRLMSRSFRYILVALFPIVLSTVLFSFDGLRLWLGADFAAHSFRVLQWIAIGVLVNCVAQVPFSAIQGIGRPDITAKLHLLELPLYVALLWVLLRRWGIEGAALAWTLRVTADGLALTVISLRLLPGGKAETRRLVAQLVAVASVCMTGLIPATFDTKILILIATSMVCVLMIFTWLLKKHDLALVRQVLRTYFAG